MHERIKQALEEEHLKRIGARMSELPEQYFASVTDEQLRDHARALAEIGPDRPAVVTESRPSDIANEPGAIQCTVCTADTPGLFSFLTGILGARGFNIKAGRVYTSSGGLVVDRFHGLLTGAQPAGAWTAATERELREVLKPLWSRPPDTRAVRDRVMERVSRAHSFPTERTRRLLPISIDIRRHESTTEVVVTSQDTPFFLYSLATAFALQDVSIRSVDISTDGDEVRDRFWIQKVHGGAVTTEADIERIRLSILVTKQFSHALDEAADPHDAFTRFEELVERVALGGGKGGLHDLLADPQAQRELARLLGASDFLWEDFIRLQYENLLPLLGDHKARRPLSTPSEQLPAKLDEKLLAAGDREAKKSVLNEFKDQESYLIDADHILRRETDFFFLSHRLTRLAELVVDRAFAISWNELTARYGMPGSAAGLGATYAVFGLGKMGGSALGYASDIELMMVYSDHGETDGSGRESAITNREFFERLVRSATDMIESRREAIFEIDLRLRPYGADGPQAVHIESFIGYFGASGDAHSAERLALIRLRPIAGDGELGRRIVDIRDQLIYETDSVDVGEIRELRERQAAEKAGRGPLNAKFSPGALVDLEYNVQLLQVELGRTHPELRNPGIHATLRMLSDIGTIEPDETESMIRAYRFLRNLINGLRMLRGNAQDLFLPAFETREAVHLARRMGYEDTEDLAAAEQLRVDFEVETAAVRSFVERHLGQEALPTSTTGNPADVVLSDTLSEERIAKVLRAAGFRNPSRGIVNLRRMAGNGTRREMFARLVVLAWDYLRRSGDPDMALNNWDRFTEQVGDREGFYSQLLAQPRRMEVMLVIFAGSQFLSDTLIRTPSFLEWISDPAVVDAPREESVMIRELASSVAACGERMSRLNELRRFRRREILRIGARDICLGGDFRDVVWEISALARAVLEVALAENGYAAGDQELRRIVQAVGPAPEIGRFCILAFGKLGGGELNYSSDIDLLAIYDPNADLEDQERNAGRVFRGVVRDLTDFTEDGQAYRVDLRLRPWGNAGRLVYSVSTLERYYAREAELWELQALLKLAPVAGDRALGWELLESLKPIFAERTSQSGRETVLRTVRRLRARGVAQHDAPHLRSDGIQGADVKNGEGGIRDIEFMVQALQMMHHRLAPQILTGNTLSALARLEEAGILESSAVSPLRADYLFLRRIEHFLQVYEDQQLHSIPTERAAQEKMTRVVLGEGADPERLFARLEETLTRVRAMYLQAVGTSRHEPGIE